MEGREGSIRAGRAQVVGDVADVDALDLDEDAPVAYVTQTTLSVDDTRAVIDALGSASRHCAARALRHLLRDAEPAERCPGALARRVDLVLVVGARNSSTPAACAKWRRRAAYAHFRSRTRGHRSAWFDDGVGVTAGASTPEVLVTGVCARLAELGASAPRLLPGEVERARFRLPPIVDADRPRYQVISNTQDGAPIAALDLDDPANASTRRLVRRSNVAAK